MNNILYTLIKTILLWVVLTVGAFAAETPMEQRQGVDLLTADYIHDTRGNLIGVSHEGVLPLKPRPEKRLDPKAAPMRHKHL